MPNRRQRKKCFHDKQIGNFEWEHFFCHSCSRKRSSAFSTTPAWAAMTHHIPFSPASAAKRILFRNDFLAWMNRGTQAFAAHMKYTQFLSESVGERRRIVISALAPTWSSQRHTTKAPSPLSPFNLRSVFAFSVCVFYEFGALTHTYTHIHTVSRAQNKSCEWQFVRCCCQANTWAGVPNSISASPLSECVCSCAEF